MHESTKAPPQALVIYNTQSIDIRKYKASIVIVLLLPITISSWIPLRKNPAFTITMAGRTSRLEDAQLQFR
jgi:hypothetical protein